VELYDRRNPLPLQYNETMGKWLVAAAVAAMVTGCKFGAGEFACVTSSDCGAGGTCEVGLNRCSFNDLSCPAPFRRFGDLAGDNSGQCVGGQAPVDAGPDAPPVSTQVCYGSGLLRICLAAAPSAPLAYDVPARIDTSKPQMCSATVSGAAGYCVVVATTIAINANVRAIGPKPLVFLASDAITSMAGTNLDVGSYHFAAGSDPDNGAGANPTTCAPGMAPTNGGGGAGGSFAGTGGNGGDGRNATNTGGTAGAAVTTFAELRGGCPGQDGQGAAADRGTAGNGGGAVYFLAVNKIELAGNVLATGGGGNPGLRNASGAGCGGSGGTVAAAPRAAATPGRADLGTTPRRSPRRPGGAVVPRTAAMAATDLRRPRTDRERSGRPAVVVAVAVAVALVSSRPPRWPRSGPSCRPPRRRREGSAAARLGGGLRWTSRAVWPTLCALFWALEVGVRGEPDVPSTESGGCAATSHPARKTAVRWLASSRSGNAAGVASGQLNNEVYFATGGGPVRPRASVLR